MTIEYLTLECAREILIDFCQNSDCNIINKNLIVDELLSIYQKYQTDYKFSNYINKVLKAWMTNVKMYKTRSDREYEDIFRNLFKNILNLVMKKFDKDECTEIDKNYILDDLENIVLGYIHLRNIKFNSTIDDHFHINFYIHTMKLCQEKDFYRVLQCLPTSENPNPKLVKVPKGLSENINPKLQFRYYQHEDEIYCIHLQKFDPYGVIYYALSDKDFLRKNLDLFTDYETFFRFDVEKQDKIKAFINEEQKEIMNLFQISPDGVFPLVPKDIVNEINKYIFPELDFNKMVDQISIESEKKYEKFSEEIESFMNSVPSKIDLMSQTKIMFLNMVNNTTYFCTNISKIKKIRIDLSACLKNPYFRMQDQLKIISYIFLMYQSDFGTMFLDMNEKFERNVYKPKLKEIMKEVQDLKNKGVEVDWLLDILKN